MHRKYHADRGARFRNMLVFTVIVSVIVFGMVYFLFGQKEAARITATVEKPQSNATGNATNAGAACDDECLIKAAIRNSDSGFCKNVSNARWDECWLIFSNAELPACLELRNYALKKECVDDFAVFRKNATLCGALEEVDKTACEEEVNPPCMNISKGLERELCLAYRNNNSDYCASSECLLIYAKGRNDPSVCEALASETEKTACLSVLEGSNRCSQLSGVAADYCYSILAQYSNDFTYCGLIQSGIHKYDCYLSAAIEEKNKTYCEKSDLEYRWDCYTNYSLETGDLDGCLAIDEQYATGSRDGCIGDYAETFGAPAACDYLSNIYMRTNCYGNIILGNYTMTVEKCSAISQADWKDKCFTRAASDVGDATICSYILGDYERKRCGETV